MSEVAVTVAVAPARWAKLTCKHGWVAHRTAKAGSFVPCLGCGTTVRVVEVSDSAPNDEEE